MTGLAVPGCEHRRSEREIVRVFMQRGQWQPGNASAISAWGRTFQWASARISRLAQLGHWNPWNAGRDRHRMPCEGSRCRWRCSMDPDIAADEPARTAAGLHATRSGPLPGRAFRDRTSIFRADRRTTDGSGRPLLSDGQPGTWASSFRCEGSVFSRESNDGALRLDMHVAHVRALQELPKAIGHACIDVHHMHGSVRVRDCSRPRTVPRP